MFIDQYQTEDGYYELPNGMVCTSAESCLAEILGFCGCGEPDDAFLYLMGALDLIRQHTQVTFEAWKQMEADYFESSGAAYFMYYYLDAHDLTEHGTSVPGWLSQKGNAILKDLRIVFSQRSKPDDRSI